MTYFLQEWKPKMIDNPLYKGKWHHPMINNPDYKPDDKLYLYENIGYIGFEIWQVSIIKHNLEIRLSYQLVFILVNQNKQIKIIKRYKETR